MASNPVDPLQTLQAALLAPENSQEQAEVLATLRESLESRPAPIPVLVDTLIRSVPELGDTLLKRWVLDLMHFAICRSTLALEVRTQMSMKALDTLAQLLNDPSLPIVKTTIQCMTTVYPLVFRHLCSNRNSPAVWNTLTTCKKRILDMLWSPSTNLGVKLSAMKFAQRVLLVQTRGISDPRLQSRSDINLSNCPGDHPFIPVAQLEAEGTKLLEGLVTMLFSSRDVDILSAFLNSWSNLAKARPAMVPFLIQALKSWTPAALAGLSASQIKSVEKAVRILLVHISRLPGNGQYSAQINEALSAQATRMERAAVEEKKRRAGISSGSSESRKRPPSTPSELPNDAKRIKLETDNSPSSLLSSFDFTSLPANLITELIVANLEAFTDAQLTALVQTYRQTLTPPVAPPVPTIPKAVVAAVATPAATPPSPSKIPTGPRNRRKTPPPPEPVRIETEEVKEEPVDPLQMVVDDEEIEFEPEKLNNELAGQVPVPETAPSAAVVTDLTLLDFKLPPPPDWEENDRSRVISKSVHRIWDGADELKAFGESIPVDSSLAGGNSPAELWMLLFVRMITRVAKSSGEDITPSEEDGNSENQVGAPDEFYARQDQLRQTMCDYIMTDFPARVRLATTWMNEEWYNDRTRTAKDPSWRPNYETWLSQIVASYQTVLDGKDRTFARFLLDLPSVPVDVLDLLRELCVDGSAERLQVGYTTLRGLVMQRPSMRIDALNVLLDLTTHPERKTRAAAINTVKMWVPNAEPMTSVIKEFALQMLRKLQHGRAEAPAVKSGPGEAAKSDSEASAAMPNGTSEETSALRSQEQNHSPEKVEGTGSINDVKMEDEGETPDGPEELVHTSYLPERVDLPADKQQVLQHVELLFALSVKVPEFLEEIFMAFGQMDVSVQEAIQQLITALIRSLGPNHGKLLTLLRTCPPGSENLALRVLTIFTESGRPSSQLVALVKSLIAERDLDARFLIPIIAEMDKSDIVRYLPRIVSILNGQPEPKNLVRSVFSSVVTTPPQTFGSVTSNMPRVRQSELLTPAELMVILHEAEKEIGVKSAMEAIGICFNMTDVFRSEILAVVMQQIVDEPVLPVLFMRTVIQTVTTYKSLIQFVSTSLLSRLITKKIWTNPPLWEGFIRLAKVIAPASFGSLLQLPKDQLRELVDKQPSLKAGLRNYVTKKAPNKARVAGYMEIFGEGTPTPESVPSPVAVAPSPGSTPQPEGQPIPVADMSES